MDKQKFLAFVKSSWKNLVVKKKVKAFLHFLFDSEYRAQLNYIYDLTRPYTKLVKKELNWWSIERGHKLIYPKYSSMLWHNDECQIDPIKVVWDPKILKYRVVDGNHRLAAVTKRSINKAQPIICEVCA